MWASAVELHRVLTLKFRSLASSKSPHQDSLDLHANNVESIDK